MTDHFNNLKKLINDERKCIGTDEDIRGSIQAVEKLAKSLLGSTLSIRGNKFIIRMLEIYYGGIGDDAHDWYRTDNKQTSVQNEAGFRVYLKNMNLDWQYNRFDIVVGPEGVPVSFLVRGVWDSDFKPVESNIKKGNPNLVLKRLGLKAEDHGKNIGFNDSKSEIFIEDTSDEIKKREGLEVKQQKRKGPKSINEFEDNHDLQWNFYLE